MDAHVRQCSAVRVAMLWPLFERFVTWATTEGFDVTLLPDERGGDAYIAVPLPDPRTAAALIGPAVLDRPDTGG